MRPLTPAQAVTATRICARFPRAHGTPVHFGNPAAIGIRDLARPDFGEPVEIRPGEVPVFWACGVTPQAVVMTAKPEFVITHKPGHMFLTDLKDTDLEGERVSVTPRLESSRGALAQALPSRTRVAAPRCLHWK